MNDSSMQRFVDLTRQRAIDIRCDLSRYISRQQETLRRDSFIVALLGSGLSTSVISVTRPWRAFGHFLGGFH
ncbi:MAG: hypothetical protein ACOCXT_00010 [Candidatus Dojkabacteria bacterium]